MNENDTRLLMVLIWLQIDLLVSHKVSALLTQGSAEDFVEAIQVKNFILQFGMDSTEMVSYEDNFGIVKVV